MTKFSRVLSGRVASKGSNCGSRRRPRWLAPALSLALLALAGCNGSNSDSANPSSLRVAEVSDPTATSSAGGPISANGEPEQVSLVRPGDSSEYVFTGLAGQSISVATRGGSFADNCGVKLKLIDADGYAIGDAICAGQSGSLPATVLRKDGSYKLVLKSGSEAAGRLMMSLTANAGPASITPGARALAATRTPAAGESIRYGFVGTPGSRIAARMAKPAGRIATDSCVYTLRLYAPDGSALTEPTCADAGATLPAMSAKSDGVYQLEIRNVGTAADQARLPKLQVFQSQDAVGSMATAANAKDGMTASAAIAEPGQRSLMHFSGRQGERYRLLASESKIATEAGPPSDKPRFDCDETKLSVLRPDGSLLASNRYCGANGYIKPFDLDASGDWTVVTESTNGGTGNAKLALMPVSSSVATTSTVLGTIPTNGSAVTATISTPGDSADFTFNGIAGRRFSLLVNNPNFPDSNDYIAAYLLRPDGSIRASITCFNDPNCLLDPFDGTTSSATALETSGTWTVSLHALYENSAGSAQLRLYTVTDQTGSIASDGTAVTSTITVPGQRSIFTFAGTAGQRFSTLTTPATGFPNSYYVHFRRPDGSLYIVAVGSDTTPIQAESVLDQTGEWAVVLDPIVRGTGNTSIQLYRPVDQTGSIPSNGTAQTVTIGTPGQNAALTFTGTAGQRISLALSDVALGDCSAYSTASIRLQRPDGSEFSTQASYYCSGGFLEFGTLDQSGTWTIILDPQGAITGNATLRLYAATDTIATIATNGTAQTATFTTPGQVSLFTFSATGGQRYSVRVSGASLTPDNGGYVTLDRPDGSSVSRIGFNNSSDGFIDAFEVDQTGTWTVRIDPYSDDIGTITVQVYAVTDQTGTISTNGTARAVNITTPGQNARFTFTGSVGQRYSLRSSDNVFSGPNRYGFMRLFRPDGSELSGTAFYEAGSFAEPAVLDQAGTWTVQLDLAGSDTLTGNIRLNLVTDQTGTIASNGTALAVNLSTPGQRALLSFSGTAGQRYTLRLADASFSTYGYVTVSFVRPDGTTALAVNFANPTDAVEPLSLDQTGNWSLRIDPLADSTGTATARLNLVADQTGTIAINGAAVTSTTTLTGQRSRFTFTGAVGASMTVTVRDAVFSGSSSGGLSLVRPDGSTLVFANYSHTGVGPGTVAGSISNAILDQAGTWAIVLDPYGDQTATASVQLVRNSTGNSPTTTPEPAPISAIATNGTPVSINLASPTPAISYSFTGTAGQRYSIRFTDSTLTSGAVLVYLRRPDGVLINGAYLYNPDDGTEAFQIDQTGTWRVVVETLGGTGTASLRLYAVTDQTGTIATNGTASTSTITVPGQNSAFTFTGTAGERYSVLASNSTFNSGNYGGTFYLRAPDGSGFGGGSLYASQNGFSEPVVLNQSGTWTVVVDPYLRGGASGTGTASIQLYRITDQAAALNSNGTAVNANLTVPGQRTAFTFNGTAGQRYSVQITSSNLNGIYGYFQFYLRRPDGTLVNGRNLYDQSGTQFVGPFVLEQSGTWTVILDPYIETTGTATVRLYLTTDQSGTAPTNGTTFNASITTPGQQAVFNFDGVAGERYSLDVSNLNFAESGYAQIYYRRPGDGGLVYSGIAYSPGGFIEPIQLDRSGSWQVIVSPFGSSTGTPTTGTATLKLYRVIDPTVALANDGTAMITSLTVPGQRALFTFNGTAGERYSLRFSNANFVGGTYPYQQVLIRRPDGATSLYNYVYNEQPTFIDADSLVLSQSGIWTVIVDPYDKALGSVTAQLYRANDQTGTLLPDGSPLASTITVPGQRSRLSFNATGGQVYDLTVQESSFNSPDSADTSGCQASFSLMRPDNSLYQGIQGNTCLPGTAFRNVPLDTAGTWSVLVNPYGPVLGTANVRLTLKGSPVPTYWADLTSAVPGTPGTAAGTIGAPIPVGFSYAGEVGGDTRIDNSYPSWAPTSTFAGGTVADAPTIRDSLQLFGGSTTAVNTISFARAVRNPVLAVVGIGSGNVQNLGSFVFSGQPFTIQAGGYSNDYGGTSILASGDAVVGNNGNGTVQFNGTFSAISWTNPLSDEYRVIVGIPLQPPPAPTGVTAAAASTQVTLNWAAAQTAATYNVYRSTTASDPSPVLVASDITGLSTVITGLTNDTTYYFRVAGVNAGGTGARSAEVSAIPGPTIRINDVSVTEGNSGTTTASFTVTLSRAATSTVTVAYATANGTASSGSDYVATSGTLSFTAGQTSRTVAVTVNGDLTVEPSETLRVNLSTPTNATIADSQGVATIVNDDLPTASINDVTVSEGNSGTASATFTISLSAAAVAPVTVAYATADGTATAGSDYAAASGTASFAVGQSTQTVTVLVNGDLLVEPSETFVVNLSAPTAATIADAQGVGTIGNDDATALSIADATVTEGNAGTVTASFTVSLSAASALPVTVAYATADGTATAGSDYVATSGTLNFAAGQTTQTISVTVNGDTVVEGNESFVVNLSAATGATIADGLGLGSIGNDDVVPVTLSINDVSVTEGNAGTVNATFTVSLSAASATPVTVAYATADGTAAAGSDYLAASGTLSFAAGQTTQTFSVLVNGDTVVEPNEGFVVNLSAASGATIADAQGAATIVNDDVASTLPSVTINDVSTTEGNTGTKTVVVTLTLSAAATSDVSVRFATAPGTATVTTDYVNSSGLLTFTPGQTVRTRSFTINGDTLAEPNETFFVNLSTPTGLTIADAQAVVTILDDDAAATPTISIGDVSLSEGNTGTTAATFTVSLSSAATAPVTVAYATADGTATAGTDYAAASGALSFAAGQSSQTITVQVTGDTTVEPDEGFVVNLSAPSGATLADAQGAATIVNDDAGVTLPSVTIGDVSIVEGNAGTRTVTVTLTLSAAQSSDVSVRFATSPGTATVATDYVNSSGLLTFTAGQTTRSRNFTINGDTAVEPNETFFVNLSTPTGLTIADSQAVVTIIDDDGAVTPTVSIGDVSVTEGNAGTISATFTVTLSSAAATPVTVAFATADGTATAGSDYAAASGTVSFAAGQVSQTVTVAVNGDTVVEADEGFVVNLSVPSGATIADGQGAATIVNDDAGSSLPSVTIADISVTEGNAGTKTVTVTLTLSAAQASDVSVRFATAPGTATATTDYVSSSGVLSFTAGTTTRSRNFTINGDTAVEPNETFFVNLSTPVGLTIADPQAVVTIVNDD